MSDGTSDIPEAYAAYLEEERRAHAPMASKAAVLRRLEASLPGLTEALAAPGDDDIETPEAPGARSGGALSRWGGQPWLRAVGFLALGGTGGFALHARLATPQVVYVQRTNEHAGAASTSPERSELVIPVSSLPSVVDGTPPSKTVRSGTPLDRETTLAVERALLDRARNALMRGDAAEADGILREHESRFARGALREEREALVIKVLARTGRIDDARARAERFRAEFPHSLLSMGIDAELR